MDNKKIVIFGGGTVFHVRPHLSLCAPAYGNTARRLAVIAQEIIPEMDVRLILTKMCGQYQSARLLNCVDMTKLGPETNADIKAILDELVQDDTTKVIIMSAALCDYEGSIAEGEDGKYGDRLQTSEGSQTMLLEPAAKLIGDIRKERKDIFLVGFKTTAGATADEQYIAGLNLCKKSSCNLVFSNDVVTRLNMVITPEESRYHETTNREEALRGLLTMVFHRTHLTFTRSTVVAGDPIPWSSPEIPSALRTVVNFCIENNAYKPFNGITAGHFACKINENTFLTSIRKTNFNDLAKNGLVKIVTDGPDTVLAYGARPSVGGQSQRIVFRDHPDVDCIVHFHCPLKTDSKVPVVSQKEFECGSHECGKNTSKGLQKFGNLYATFLENHGPNIVFNSSIDPQEVIDFVNENFDLTQKTGGFVSIKSRLETPSTLETAQRLL